MRKVQQRLDANPQAMRVRRETAEHAFGTLKARMGATLFLMKSCRKPPPKCRCMCSPISGCWAVTQTLKQLLNGLDENFKRTRRCPNASTAK
jgi:hypothetical protein